LLENKNEKNDTDNIIARTYKIKDSFLVING
jgi:hypothetical protein